MYVYPFYKITVMKIFTFLCFQLLSMGFLFAQNAGDDASLYNPGDFYLPTFNPTPGNSYRSANGAPGPMYWQNSASYLIHAILSERDTSISGDVTIAYTNNSPDKLEYLWLQLDQNLFDPQSRGAATVPFAGVAFGINDTNNGGYHIADVTITYHDKIYKVQPVISDTRMQLYLKTPLLPKGDRINIKINYTFFIPAFGSDRMGRM